jgi:hypothetical protein
MVEPTIFGRAEQSQSGSKLDLLEPSCAKKLKFDIAWAELSPKARIFQAIRLSRLRKSIKHAQNRHIQ